ncbi:hypothetical protein BWI93_23760, partial [Siphonobacter sp. BAB-5385]|uniref:hypothetical protein n=1 Tax=Siphonobacter sp. BAB-5385 TaxID=1864822 RepID=UPI000BCCFCFB
DWDYYENVKGMFDATTGYLKAPNADDVQYDNALSKFVRYDGSAWVDIAESTLNFTFNFAKYRQAWNIAQPDVFHSMLGTNDFSFPATFDATYATFKARYETMIASIKADSPNCKIIIAIPVSSGRQGVDGIATTERRKRVFWMLAKAINADFGGRESQGVYIADYHSTVDRTFGYDRTFEKPFFNYTGSET